MVTGAASGIGAAVAQRLEADGAKVFRADMAGEVDHIADLTADGANKALVAAAADAMGGLDTLVPCAGISTFTPLEGHKTDYFRRVMEVNCTAVFRLIRDAIPHLKQAGNGRIVTIGSTASSFGDAGLAAYAASKHAVLGLAKSAAVELGPIGTTVNCIQPGPIETPMTRPALQDLPGFQKMWEDKTSTGRIGQPDDVAGLVAFLCSDDARHLSGHGIFVDGGAMARH